MNKEELEIAKKIAEIDGVAYTVFGDESIEGCWIGVNDESSVWADEYNPFNWSILGPLMVKHKVSIDYDIMIVAIYNEGSYSPAVDFKDNSKIPSAILKCIIKSNER